MGETFTRLDMDEDPIQMLREDHAALMAENRVLRMALVRCRTLASSDLLIQPSELHRAIDGPAAVAE